MQVADPDQDTTGCKKKPNEPSSKQAGGCDLMSHVFDIMQNLTLLTPSCHSRIEWPYKSSHVWLFSCSAI